MEHIQDIKAYAKEHSVPIMQDGGIDFICKYIKEHNVKKVLEIGTAIGYSSIKFANLRDDIFVTTVEMDIDRYQQAVRNVNDCNLMDRITLYLGDALTCDFDDSFDLIFIDAAKAQYTRYFEKFKNNLTSDGVIITDNLKFHGFVNDLSLTHNYSTKKLIQKLRKFIDFLKYNNEFDTQFFDLGDGVSLSRRKKLVTQYIVDSFADKTFTGKSCAVCVTESPLNDRQMINMAKENGMIETAFACKDNDKYNLRFFTSEGEIESCAHGTIACAFVIMTFIEKEITRVTFELKSGDLTVNKKDSLYELKLPVFSIEQIPLTQQITDALGSTPSEVYKGRDLVCVFEDEKTVRELTPDFNKLKELEGLMVHVTCKGKDFGIEGYGSIDCISRTFNPKGGINEEAISTDGHCHLIPYWALKLNKKELIAYQASSRGGYLYCNLDHKRVYIAGRTSLYSISKIYI